VARVRNFLDWKASCYLLIKYGRAVIPLSSLEVIRTIRHIQHARNGTSKLQREIAAELVLQGCNFLQTKLPNGTSKLQREIATELVLQGCIFLQTKLPTECRVQVYMMREIIDRPCRCGG
jgi:hypothetical protein